MKEIKQFVLLLKPYKRKVYLAFTAIIAANALGLAFPWGIKVIIDEVVLRKNTPLLTIIGIALALIVLVRFYFGFVREYTASSIGERVVCDLRNRLYWHLQRLSVRYIDSTSTGKLISNVIGDVESIREFLFGGVLDFVYSFFNLFFVFALLLILDWRLTLISLACLPAFGITFFKLTPRLREKHRAVREKYGELTARLSEVFAGMRIVAAFSREDSEARRFESKQKEILQTSLESHRLGILLWMGSEALSSLGLVILLWCGAGAVGAGRITPGILMAFYSYLGMLFVPVIKMVIINNDYQEAAASMERIQRILDRQPEIKKSAYPVVVERIRGDIKFNKVSFSYDGRKEALSEITLEAKENEVVALVGKSGAGKTTLINLLLRFYDPTKGAVFIDSHNLKDLELKSYRSKIAMVLQDDYLFSTTIKDNILYGRPDASVDDIIKVAKLARAHQFIMELPHEYNTEIGERGITLSYGQRQRISIARAILRDPSILILDEATSCVDSETERRIIEGAYKNLMRNRTTFIIAHRLSAITYADKVVFIEKGSITEMGRHSQLLDKKGSYWKMWMEQYADKRPLKLPPPKDKSQTGQAD